MWAHAHGWPSTTITTHQQNHASRLLILLPKAIVFTARAILSLLIQMEGVRSKTDQQVGPDQPDRKSTLHSPSNVADCIGKWCHSIKDEEATEHARKRPRTQESRQYYHCSRPSVNVTHPSAVNERHQIPKGKRKSQPPRKSTRLQEIRDSSQQGIARAEKQKKPLPKPTKTPPYVGQQAERRTLTLTRKCQLDFVMDVVLYNADQPQQNNAAFPRTRTKDNTNAPRRTQRPNKQVDFLLLGYTANLSPVSSKSADSPTR